MVQNKPGPVSPLLNLYLTCKDLGCLPDPGGLYQQQNKIYEVFQIARQSIAESQSEKGGGNDV
jgi:hypothetical protein